MQSSLKKQISKNIIMEKIFESPTIPQIEFTNMRAGLIKVILTNFAINLIFYEISFEKTKKDLQNELDANLSFVTRVFIDDKSNEFAVSGHIVYLDIDDKLLDIAFNFCPTGGIL